MSELEILEFLCFTPPAKEVDMSTIFQELSSDLELSRDISDLCLRSATLLERFKEMLDSDIARNVVIQQAELLSRQFVQLSLKCPKMEIRSVVKEYIRQGKTLREIADLLNAQGYTTGRGKRWMHSAVFYHFKDLFNTEQPVFTVRERAKELRERKLSLEKVAEKLNEEGFTTARGGKFTFASVHALLNK